MFSWMVASMSAIVACLFLIWLLSPALRRRMETPKHRMLERELLHKAHGRNASSLPNDAD